MQKTTCRTEWTASTKYSVLCGHHFHGFEVGPKIASEIEIHLKQQLKPDDVQSILEVPSSGAIVAGKKSEEAPTSAGTHRDGKGEKRESRRVSNKFAERSYKISMNEYFILPVCR